MGVVALCLIASAPAQADVVTSNLAVWLDAADYNGSGVAGVGSGTAWTNLAGTGATYNGTLATVGSGPGPAWSGTGTSADPYRVQFRPVSDSNGPLVTIANSGLGSPLDTGVFTYEIWARRDGAGTADFGSGVTAGALIDHNTVDAGQGNGGIIWKGTDSSNYLETLGGSGSPSVFQFPGSSNVFTKTQYDQFVFTRAGDGLRIASSTSMAR